MPTTLQDIARTVNLSESLVRGVLKNKPNVWASEANRRRILEAARELNYRPNAAAQALATGSTKTVGFTYLRPKNERTLREVTGSVAEACAERLSEINFSLALHVYDNRDALMESLNTMALSRSCDAFVLWGAEGEIEEPGCLLESLNVPFVVKGYFDDTHSNWLQIDFDHEKMMHNAVDLLSSLGHQRIAYLGTSYPLRWEQHYLKGYRDAMRRVFGEEVDPRLISQPIHSLVDYEKSMSDWLTLPPDECPTAVIVTTDARAWRAIEIALARVGRRAGVGSGEVLIVGCARHDDSVGSITLMHGQGYAFDETSMAYLGEMLGEKLLNPVLRNQTPEQNIVRLLPALALTNDEFTSAYHQATEDWIRSRHNQ
jgi:DNA-binding LacI/PurR family transcriptional regulator